MSNGINQISPSASSESQLSQINKNFVSLDQASVTKVYRGPTGNAAVIEGKLPDPLGSGILMNDLNGLPSIYMATTPAGTPVLKVAKTGENATTAPNSGLVFNSAQNVFKIVTSGTYILTRPAGSTSKSDSVPHGLSYLPIVIFNVEQTTTQPGVWYSGAQNVRVNSITGIIVEMPIVTVDATNVIFSTIAPSNGGENALQKTFTFKYYLLQETAN